MTDGSGIVENGAAHDLEEDEDVKLLRLRTTAHEIIIIPDRRFLLCVIHDVLTGATGPGNSGGTGNSHSR